MTGANLESNKGRGNEFWLALAGIGATVVIGLAGGWLTYQSSINQINSETTRQTIQFSREQRKAAYVDYLVAYKDLRTHEFRLASEYKRLGDADPTRVIDLHKDYTAAFARSDQVDATMSLVGSEGVIEAHIKNVQAHDAVRGLIDEVGRHFWDGSLWQNPDKADRLERDSVATYDDLQRLIDVAKNDLDLAS